MPQTQAVENTYFLDHQDPGVRAFAEKAVRDAGPSAREQAVSLYYAVRDGIFYEVYGMDVSKAGLRASSIVRDGRGFCLHKSILYAAAARSLGIPCRLVFCEVRNHVASDRLRGLMGGDEFLHWLVSVHIDGRWVKATPVFNRILCQLYGMEPLEFDGVHDSSEQPYTDGQRMEFLRTFGEFDDLPYDLLVSQFSAEHPGFFTGTSTAAGGSLAGEAR